MSLIKLLSDQEAKKIAAGEVVERPASVVKELIENSLDAGATKISLYIEKSGKDLIRIVDDGCGMMPVDAKICFDNHATSKIKSLNDLQNIKSFGFRGEALASISSVSKVTLQTRFNSKDYQEETGVRIFYIDGKVVEEQAVSCAYGTDLQIQELFYNTPVRKKFLKQDETEWNQIQNLFYAFCLSNLSTHFQLYRDGKLVLNAPQIKTIKDRVMQIWGHNMAQNLIETNDSENISGLISKHNFWRYSRNQIFFFVNGRWVKNLELSKALMKGYRQVLPPARFPSAFLFLKIDNSLVDINVHPRKEEVRFIKPVSVANSVTNLVTKTLEELISNQLKPMQNEPLQGGPLQDVSLQNEFSQNEFSQEKPFQKTFSREPLQNEFLQTMPTQTVVTSEKREVRVIGQLLKTYIVIENDDGLLLIDQHAAHERILYEKYLKNFEKKDGVRLLFPEIINLSERQLKLVLSEKNFLNLQGIEVEQIGPDKIAIKSSPPKIGSASLHELVFEMIEFMEQNEKLDQETFRKKLNEHVHSQMACKMAVKAGHTLSIEMMENIIDQLQQVDNRFICVHGRPTTWSVSKSELEKKFRRS